MTVTRGPELPQGVPIIAVNENVNINWHVLVKIKLFYCTADQYCVQRSNPSNPIPIHPLLGLSV